MRVTTQNDGAPITKIDVYPDVYPTVYPTVGVHIGVHTERNGMGRVVTPGNAKSLKRLAG